MILYFIEKYKVQFSLVTGDCSHEIKTRSLLGRKVMTNLEGILKSRDIKKKKAETLLCQQKLTLLTLLCQQKFT